MKLLFLVFMNLIMTMAHSQTVERDLKKYHLLITGKPITVRHPNYQDWINKLEEGKKLEVALELTKDPGFGNQVVFGFASHYLSLEKERDIRLNDAISLIIGIARDDKDARDILRANYSYGPTLRMGLGRPALNSNLSYTQLEKKTADFVRFLDFYTPQWSTGKFFENAGLLTTRWWGEKYYEGGTNRRSVVGLMNTFLCTPIESWKTSGLSTKYIRRDIPRDPSGDPRIFQTECRSCHGAMDAMGGAFAHMDFANSTLIQTTAVQAKYSNLSHVYPEGYITTDSYWKNLLVVRNDLGIEWSKKTEGKGLKDIAEMVVTSETFGACLAKRAVSYFCQKNLSLTDSWIQELSDDFKGADQYQLKKLFTKVVVHEKCK